MRLTIGTGALLALVLVTPLVAQNYSGTYVVTAPSGGTVTLLIKQDATGNATGSLTGNGATFQLTGKLQGPELVGQATGSGANAWFEASLEGAELHLVLADLGPNGQPNLERAQEITLTRSGNAATPAKPGQRAPVAVAPPAHAPAPPAAAPPSGGSPQDRQLTQLLLSSAWCSFSYNQTSGTTKTSRSQFQPNGVLVIGTNAEGGTTNQNGGGTVDLGGGATGSVYGQSRGGQQARWQVQGGQLFIDLGQGMQMVPLSITRNSNGYPIITANGSEYSQCR
jgi:hypothetical protein